MPELWSHEGHKALQESPNLYIFNFCFDLAKLAVFDVTLAMAVENGSAGVFTDSYLTGVGTNKPSVMWRFDFPVFYDPSLVRAVMIRTEEKVNEIKQKEGDFERNF